MAASTQIGKLELPNRLIDGAAADLEEISKTISTLHEPGALIELCGIKENGIDSGYYDDHTALARDAKKLSDSGTYDGVYITVNPVKRDVPEQKGRKKNQMSYTVTTRTRDEDIESRRWLPVDFDPVRAPRKSSATDRQKGGASVCKSQTIDSLRDSVCPHQSSPTAATDTTHFSALVPLTMPPWMSYSRKSPKPLQRSFR